MRPTPLRRSDTAHVLPYDRDQLLTRQSVPRHLFTDGTGDHSRSSITATGEVHGNVAQQPKDPLMSTTASGPSASHPAAPASITREERKVLAGTLVGTTIEWYDFFIYAQAAGLVLSAQYFGPLASDNPALGQIMAWASLGISFLFRPLGAIIAGHLGDRIGRKKMLVLTLILMGAATSLIGLLPNYAMIGVGAPILLTLLRILQGFSAGGEWGGAALLSVEHAPISKRGIFGAYPQIGVPVGMILATGVIWILTTVLSPEQFASFGWRIPFLFSVVLVLVGYLHPAPGRREPRLR